MFQIQLETDSLVTGLNPARGRFILHANCSKSSVKDGLVGKVAGGVH